MDYRKIYHDLCFSRKRERDLTYELGYELHHIIPTALGGPDNNTNITKLTYREHLLAHKLLTKITKSPAMYQAYYLMIHVNKVGSEKYIADKEDIKKYGIKYRFLWRGYPNNCAGFIPIKGKLPKAASGNNFLRTLISLYTKEYGLNRLERFKQVIYTFLTLDLDIKYIYTPSKSLNGRKDRSILFLIKEGYLELKRSNGYRKYTYYQLTDKMVSLRGDSIFARYDLPMVNCGKFPPTVSIVFRKNPYFFISRTSYHEEMYTIRPLRVDTEKLDIFNNDQIFVKMTRKEMISLFNEINKDLLNKEKEK